MPKKEHIIQLSEIDRMELEPIFRTYFGKLTYIPISQFFSTECEHKSARQTAGVFAFSLFVQIRDISLMFF